MYKLKAAPRKEANPILKVNKPETLKDLMKIIISPIKLGLGGAAMFVTLNRNHHIDIKGVIVSPPRKTNMLRDDSRS